MAVITPWIRLLLPALFVVSSVHVACVAETARGTVAGSGLISVDFVSTYPDFEGLDVPVSGDTTPTALTPPKNADGLIFAGQVGPWNAFNVDPSSWGNFTYKVGTAPSGVFTNGVGTATTVRFAITSAFRCNVYNYRLTGSMRRVSIDCDVPMETADPVTWYITGLVPNAFYQLICFSCEGGTYKANGVAAKRDSEGDANWDSVQADETGTIYGTMSAGGLPNISMYGFQIRPRTSPPFAKTTFGQVVIFWGPLGLVLFWVWRLRGQLKQKSRELAAEMAARHDAAVEFEATLRERKRLAANLHDTLLQTITGLAYQIEACEAESLPLSDRKSNHLATARRMVRRAQNDLRGTVWALHTMPLQGRSFPEALDILVEQLTDGYEVESVVETDPHLPDISEFVAGNLLLVAQEAIANALKHAQPSRIEIQVTAPQDGGHIKLEVRDNGCGFDCAAQQRSPVGHFGLDGMRDRLGQLEGELRIESQPGQGTKVIATVPQSAFDTEPG